MRVKGDEEEETIRADLGGGWGRIIYSPMRRGKQYRWMYVVSDSIKDRLGARSNK
jgi:hypothetical protein